MITHSCSMAACMTGISLSKQAAAVLLKLRSAAFSRTYCPQRFFRESHGYVPTLSPPEVTSLLSMHEARVEKSVKGNYVISAFESNQVASNSPIEDRRAVAKLLQNDATLFGIFDGHGGPACAQAVSERLFDYISVSLLPQHDLETYSHSLKTDNPEEILEWMTFLNDYRSEEFIDQNRMSLHRYVVETLSMSGFEDHDHIDGSVMGEALKAAFTRLDNDLSTEAMPVAGSMNDNMRGIALSGSCAIVAHVDGLNIHVANTGDCRAVLGRVEDNGKWLAVPLSSDHNVENQAEAMRIKKSHPQSESTFLLKSNRLLGQLVPLRAFGDVRYKWRLQDLKVLETLCGHSIIPMNYYTPPYLIAEPEIRYHRLGPRDKFMVLASDGLWEMLSNEAIVTLVGEHMEGRATQDKYHLQEGSTSRRLGNINKSLINRQRGLSHRSIDSNVATHLIRHALGYEHRLVSEMLTFPPYISRHYRDDITVTVVYFDTDYIINNKDSKVTEEFISSD